MLDESSRKKNKLWVDIGRSMKLRLEKSNVEMYSRHNEHNEGKSVIAERFIKILKTKIYKYIASLSKKCVY